ncbi:MAG: hypothetical protein GKR87_01245 [Kiritimatiellae bacterium]|nr:hypothetical protein [Kiritimatiellia bacterium]
MDTLTIFGLQLVLSLIVYALIAKWYVTPWLTEKPIRHALIPLIFPHAIRHIGLIFFVPGVVAQPLPSFFVYTAAYGDLISGLLALLSLVALRGGWRLALPLVWLFNSVGTVDLLNALRQAEAVSDLGATWYIPTFWVPILLVTHFMIFTRLLKRGR